MQKINTLKSKVEYCLQKYESTRGCDKNLTNAVWVEFYNKHLNRKEKEYYIKLKEVYYLPSLDSISRIRRKFNEKNMYLPNNEVLAKRGRQEEKWKNWSNCG